MIRKAAFEDLSAINRLSAEFGYGVVSEEVARERVRKVLDSEIDELWVYEEGGQVFGWIHAIIALRVASEPFVEIGGLVVDSAFRKRGAGRALVAEAKQWADELQLSLRVRCNAMRSATHLFYESIGFSKSKEQYVFVSRY